MLEIPVKLVEGALGSLKEMGFIIEVVDEGRKNVFQPARPVENMTVGDVVKAYDRSGDDVPPARSDEERERYDRLRLASRPPGSREDAKLRDL